MHVSTLELVRRLSSVLPETAEVDVLDAPTFRVATRMFAAVETDGATPVVRFKASPSQQEALLRDERFEADADTGHYGWTNLRADGSLDPDELERLLLASYRLVAPAEVLAQLDARLAAADDPGSMGH